MILAATTHDPEGQFVPILEKWFSLVAARFEKIVVASSPGLHPETEKILRQSGADVYVIGKNIVGLNYRTAIKEAAKHGAVLYVDLDRILHWVSSFPEELDKIISALPGKEWVIFERNPRAMATHHEPLKATEPIFSLVIDSLSGWGRRDFLSGAFYFSKSVANLFCEKVTNDEQGWWGQYLVAMLKNGLRPEFISCEGLEWETPDRFQKEIELAGGFEKWKKQLEESPREWAMRVDWVTQWIDAALDAWKRV